MSSTQTPGGGTPTGSPKGRHPWLIALVVVVVLAVAGVGIGIWRYQDSGGTSTPAAAANEAPGDSSDSNGVIDITLRSTFMFLPTGTHVTIAIDGPLQCVDNQKSQSFDVNSSPFSRRDVVFQEQGGPCFNKGKNSWMTVTATNSSGTKTRRVNLYREHGSSAYQINCDGGDPTTLTCTAAGGGANFGTVQLGWR